MKEASYKTVCIVQFHSHGDKRQNQSTVLEISSVVSEDVMTWRENKEPSLIVIIFCFLIDHIEW